MANSKKSSSKKSTKSTKTISTSLLTAIAYIVIGALFVIFRTAALGWLMTAVGIILIAVGVYYVIRKDLVKGLI